MRTALLVIVASFFGFAQSTPKRLSPERLEAVHNQRLEWMKQRTNIPPLTVYQDFRAVFDASGADSSEILKSAQGAEVRIVIAKEASAAKSGNWRGLHDGVLFLSRDDLNGSLNGSSSSGAPQPSLPIFAGESHEQQDSTAYLARVLKEPKEKRRLESKLKEYPVEVSGVLSLFSLEDAPLRTPASAFGSVSTHILARELSEKDVLGAIAQGRSYIAHDWLCNPTGFALIAQNALGTFDIGDTVAMIGDAKVEAILPVPARIKLLRDGAVVAEVNDSKISFSPKEEGAYRLEASLVVDRQEQPWISTNPVYFKKPPERAPLYGQVPPNVELHRDVTYTQGAPQDAAKHELDLYLPTDRKDFPVIVFLHGGSWTSGDRAMYPGFGYRFAKAGIGVAIPSYRLMPQNPHPAQIEDAAAAFAWVYRNIEQYGGDAKHIYLAGHSAGGHLAALLALDQQYLKKEDVPPIAIRGVIGMSGVFDVTGLPPFHAAAEADYDASPLGHVHAQAPPFLITYCQWDYLTLPKQARDFAAALKKVFVDAKLIYIPGQNHDSEIENVWKDDDPTSHAILDFVK